MNYQYTRHHIIVDEVEHPLKLPLYDALPKSFRQEVDINNPTNLWLPLHCDAQTVPQFRLNAIAEDNVLSLAYFVPMCVNEVILWIVFKHWLDLCAELNLILCSQLLVECV